MMAQRLRAHISFSRDQNIFASLQPPITLAGRCLLAFFLASWELALMCNYPSTQLQQHNNLNIKYFLKFNL